MIHLAECFAWCVVQVTLFAAAAASVYWLVGRQRASGNVHLLAACFGMIAMLTAACVSPWPRWPSHEAWQTDASPTGSPLFHIAPPNPDLKDLVGETAAAQLELDPSPPSMALDGFTPMPVTASLYEEAATETRPWWLIAVWAAWLAMAIGLVRFAIGWALVGRYSRRCSEINDDALLREFETFRQQLRAPASVELRESPLLSVPATIGWRRPLVLLPPTWRAWTPDERRAVLAHELAHVAQRHFPIWVVSQLATVAHYYHPLVHWLGRRLRLEQELAADALAARQFGSRRRFAAALAGLALGPAAPSPALSGLGLFMSRPLLMRRIAMLRQPIARPLRPSRFQRGVALVLLTAAAIFAIGLRTSSTQAADDDTTAVEVTRGVITVETKPFRDRLVEATPEMVNGLPTIEVSTVSNSAPSAEASQEVTALLQVSSDATNLMGRDSAQQSWKVFSNTQLALLGSKVVMQAALRNPEIAKLPLVAAQAEPIGWLQSRLKYGFIADSEILWVGMSGTPQEAEQLRKIVDAVVQAYLDQIVSADTQRRSATRDALAKSYARLSDEIQQKMERYFSLAKELRVSQPNNTPDPEIELLMREITELSRTKWDLERQLAQLKAEFEVQQNKMTGQVDDLEALTRETVIRTRLLDKQIEAVAKAIEEKTDVFQQRQERSVELEIQQVELEELRAIAREMSLKLEMMDVEAALPQRVRVIQWAM